MRQNPNTLTVGGRSYVFNLLFVLLNLTGITCITIGFHESFVDKGTFLKIIGFGLMALATAGLLIFRGRLMMSNVSRVIVGGLLIVSGLVKANDPLGFAYKLEEYFEDGALAYRIKEWFSAPSFSLEYFIQHALLLSILICIAEIVIGIFIIIGGKMKLMSYLLVLMIAFFTFLTWHTASCDSAYKFKDHDTYSMSDPVAAAKIESAANAQKIKVGNKEVKELRVVSQNSKEVVIEEYKSPQCVNDCGCFGDAMKGSIGRSLTPKESLWKDIVVLILSGWIFLAQWITRPNTRKQNIIFTITSLLVVAFFSAIFSWYFPLVFALAGILGSLWILRSGGKIFGNYFGVAVYSILISLIFVFFVVRYEPMKDYRPYAVGSNLKEKMNNGQDGIYLNLLRYKNSKTKEEKLFDGNSQEYIDSKIWENEDWKYVDMFTQTIKPQINPSITTQFNPIIVASDVTPIEEELAFIKAYLAENSVNIIRVKNLSSGDIYEVPQDEYTAEEYTSEYYSIVDTLSVVDPEKSEISLRDYIIEADEIIILLSKNIQKADWSSIGRYRDILAKAKEKGIPMIMINSTSREAMEAFRKNKKFNIPMFSNDEIEIKAISRSNPSMLVIQKGIVTGKFSHRSTPTFDWLNKNLFNK